MLQQPAHATTVMIQQMGNVGMTDGQQQAQADVHMQDANAAGATMP